LLLLGLELFLGEDALVLELREPLQLGLLQSRRHTVTYIRGQTQLEPGKHTLRFEFQKTGTEPFGAGGTGRLYVDDSLAAEGQILRTAAFGYSLDETFDVGCDKGSPVTDEYKPLAEFTGKIIRVDFDLKPDFERNESQHAEMQAKLAMARQ
jgi:hypothetical protein